MCTSKCADCLQRGRQDIHMRAPARGAIDSVAVVGGTTSAVDGMTSTVSCHFRRTNGQRGFHSPRQWSSKQSRRRSQEAGQVAAERAQTRRLLPRRRRQAHSYRRRQQTARDYARAHQIWRQSGPSKQGSYTPLHLASQMGARPEVELLLQHSADVNRSTRHGVLPS